MLRRPSPPPPVLLPDDVVPAVEGVARLRALNLVTAQLAALSQRPAGHRSGALTDFCLDLHLVLTSPDRHPEVPS